LALFPFRAMIAPWRESDERTVYCGWCGNQLSDAERFLFELDLAGWQSGQPTIPEHPAIDTRQEPIPTCNLCRESVRTNYDELAVERAVDEKRTRRAWYLIRLIFLASLLIWAVLSFLQ
jgi:hypothetical protein